MRITVWNPFAPSNSLLVAFDRATLPVDEFESALQEVGRFYRFRTLSETLRRRRGSAAVCFLAARKGLFLRYLPILRGLQIPVTVFLHPEELGTNRLPLHEEIAAYQEQFPELAGIDAQSAWRDPAMAARCIEKARAEVGPLPYDRLNPEDFFVPWGRVLELPASSSETALALPFEGSTKNRAPIEEALRFARAQTKAPVSIAWAPFLPQGDSRWLTELGITSQLVPLKGAIDRSTDRWHAPLWELAT